jgi:hypothetical protein
MIPRELPSTSTSATYSVDKQAPVRFTLPGLSSSQNYSQFNHIFFQTDYLAPKSHELVVKYEGDANTTPLVLGSFLVDGFSSKSPKKLPIGTIVGAVVGGIALIIILFFAAIRFKYRKLTYKPVLIEEPFHYIKPFTLTRPHDPYSDAASYNPYNLSTSTLNHDPGDPNRVSPYPFTSPTAAATSYQPGAQPHVQSAPAPSSKMSRKQALAAESAMATSSRVVTHQDSGMRLPNATPEDIGLAPGYPAYGTGPRF